MITVLTWTWFFCLLYADHYCCKFLAKIIINSIFVNAITFRQKQNITIHKNGVCDIHVDRHICSSIKQSLTLFLRRHPGVGHDQTVLKGLKLPDQWYQLPRKNIFGNRSVTEMEIQDNQTCNLGDHLSVWKPSTSCLFFWHSIYSTGLNP